MNKKARKYLIILLIIISVFSSVSGILYATQKYNIIKTSRKNIHINDFIKYLNREKENYYRIAMANKTEVDMDFLSSRDFVEYSLNKLLYTTLIENDVEQYNLEEPLDLGAKKIMKEKSFLNSEGKFDNIKFMQFLEQVRFTELEFLNLIRRDDERNFLSLSFEQPIFVSNVLIDEFFNYYNAQKEAYLIRKKIASFPDSDSEISEETIKKYYNLNRTKFIVKEKKLVEYLEFTKLPREEIEKLGDSLMLADNIDEIAKQFKVMKKNLGYKTAEELLKINFIKQEILFSMVKGDFSNVIELENKVYVYFIADLKNEYVKSIEDAREEIIAALKFNGKEEIAIKKTNELIGQNKNINNYSIFAKNGYTVEKKLVSRNTKDLNEKLLNNILSLDENEYSDAFVNDDEIIFTVVLKNSKLKEGEKNYLSKKDIETNLTKSFSTSIQENYFEYLRKHKYKAKIEYKLLKFIL